jgi:hypothetical protein
LFVAYVSAGDKEDEQIEVERARLIRDEGMTDRDTLVVIRDFCHSSGPR